jgi:hypothetical protein
LIRRALAVMGKYRDRDDASDVAANHDRYLTKVNGERLKRDRRS